MQEGEEKVDSAHSLYQTRVSLQFLLIQTFVCVRFFCKRHALYQTQLLERIVEQGDLSGEGVLHAVGDKLVVKQGLSTPQVIKCLLKS